MGTTGLFDIKSSNFLGGTNVHNLITIGLLALVAIKVGAFKK
jgi:hypothetical protein